MPFAESTGMRLPRFLVRRSFNLDFEGRVSTALTKGVYRRKARAVRKMTGRQAKHEKSSARNRRKSRGSAPGVARSRIRESRGPISLSLFLFRRLISPAESEEETINSRETSLSHVSIRSKTIRENRL